MSQFDTYHIDHGRSLRPRTSDVLTTMKLPNIVQYSLSFVISILAYGSLLVVVSQSQVIEQAQVINQLEAQVGGQEISTISPLDTSNPRVNTDNNVLAPPNMRPFVSIDLKERAQALADTIHILSDKANCQEEVVQFYKKNSKLYQLDANELRRQILEHLDVLLKQHQSAVDFIVAEAERLAANHEFRMSLKVNYTDVHRLRNEHEWQNQLRIWEKEVIASNNNKNNNANNGDANGDYSNMTTSSSSPPLTLEQIISANPNFGISGAPFVSGERGNQQPTSYNGGAPVLGPPEMLTPIKTVIMNVNKNFGDIPVNTSMSAVHLPLPIYAGLPAIMNTIAWTEGLDEVFRRNLANFAHVHHQYYGDHLGPLRTFPAHKWRIPRLEPDLFDARTRPWYSAGVANPKDVVILVDTSGSMTGLRREIAKGVVFEILDTLSNNDHFVVLKFSENVTPIGLPKCQVRKPRLSLDLHSLCQQLGDPEMPPPVPELEPQSTQGVGAQLNPSGPQTSMKMIQAPISEAILRAECEAFKQQWNAQHAYKLHNPSSVSGPNASYLTDEAYFNSIRNVTSDIKDAYLLPANSRNIRYIKANFSIPTTGIANFTHGLMSAFELINAYNRTHDMGSQCNRAIMLITDGAIRDHAEIFNRYNYPGSPVRVFTYMIGREVGDIKPTKAMACKNRGYYVNVINLSEIREQVLKYLPVFARPAILAKQHPVTWTNTYGDETYQVLTDWVLEVKRREKARSMLNEERDAANSSQLTREIFIDNTNITEYDDIPQVEELLNVRNICDETNSEDLMTDKSFEDELDPLGYNELACFWAHSRRADLLTSVVKPVYNAKNTSINFERELHKNVWIEKNITLRDARLLGVGSVDLRVADMMKLAPSHLLGPNAYPILIGPNGFLLHHPDLRALLEDPFDKHSKILKPNFNSVDLSQVEQVYGRNISELNHLNKRLIKFRDAVAKRNQGAETLAVKRTIDCRRRAHIRYQTFFYGPVRDTPFTLLLSFPTDYGLTRLNAKLDLDSRTSEYLEPLNQTSANTNNNSVNQDSPTTNMKRTMWTLHPDYRYCEGGPLRRFGNDTTAAIDFLLHKNDQKNKLWSKIVPDDLTGLEQPHGGRQSSDSIHCDKNLFPSLLFDAAATSELRLMENCASNEGDSECSTRCLRAQAQSRNSLAEIFGLEMSFTATRSGLTRARLFDISPRTRKLAEVFLKRHPRTVDEPWYSRTVDFNMRYMEDGVVVSVQYNAYIRLIAKLRQRIAQRQPVGGGKTNCDASYFSTNSESTLITNTTTGDETTNISNEPSPPSSKLSLSSFEEDTTLVNTTQTNPSNLDSTSSAGTETTYIYEPTDYNSLTTYELLDLIANSSVHVTSHQTIVIHLDGKKRTPVAVTGQFYDYSSFAKSFLNKTNILIQKLEANTNSQLVDDQNSDQQYGNDQLNPPKIDLCPGGECPNLCGIRNDTLDCLLVDFNGFIVVSEELVHVGRSLAEYDDRLMSSLIEQRVFQTIKLTDYQAICTRNDQQTTEQQAARTAALAAAAAASASQSSSSSSSWHRAHSAQMITQPATNIISSLGLQVASSLLSNVASTFSIIASTLYSMLTIKTTDWPELGEIMQLSRSAIVDAQTTSSPSILSSLPNKTYLRPCERTVTVYETPISEVRSGNLTNDKPIYYASKCKCPAWYVYSHVPMTNLIMLVVNTTSQCRINCTPDPVTPIVAPIPGSPLPSDQHHNKETLFGQQNRTAEEQVCSMLERADAFQYQLAVSAKHYDTGICISNHPDESQIKICGSANEKAQMNMGYILLLISTLQALRFFL